MRFCQWVFLLCLICGSTLAQDIPAEGSVIKEKLVLGPLTFALPPGEWTVVATALTNMGAGAGSFKRADAFLVQLNASGVYVASMHHRVPITSISSMALNDDLCGRKNTLHHDWFAKRFDFEECLLLDHNVDSMVSSPSAPPEPYPRKIWEWFRANKVEVPVATLSAHYRNAISYNYVYLFLTVNPEAFGQEKSVKRNWVESEWDPLTYDQDPKRKAFVENLKKWAYVMADNARATMLNRKPRDAMLPPLEDLRVK